MDIKTLYVAWKMGAQLEYRTKPDAEWEPHAPYRAESADEYFINSLATGEELSATNAEHCKRLEFRIRP